MNKRYQIFVSSTYADLKEERQAVIRTIIQMDGIPAGMELFPAADEEQLAFIKRIIDDCDYYLLIIGGRYGSISESGISYTEQEYDYAVSRGLKVIALLHENPDEIPLGKSEKEPAAREMLQKFRDKASGGRVVKFWKNAGDLPSLVTVSLTFMIKAFPAVGWVRASAGQGEAPRLPVRLVFRRDLKNELPWNKVSQQVRSALYIWAWSGVAAYSPGTRNTLKSLLDRKKTVNFMILNSDAANKASEFIQMNPVCSWTSAEVRKDISDARAALVDLRDSLTKDQRPYLRLKETSWFMAWSGLAIDPEKRSGVLQIENYLYDYADRMENHLDFRPNLLIAKSSEFFEPYWFSISKMWQRADEIL